MRGRALCAAGVADLAPDGTWVVGRVSRQLERRIGQRLEGRGLAVHPTGAKIHRLGPGRAAGFADSRKELAWS